jgi:hypothetical protein
MQTGALFIWPIPKSYSTTCAFFDLGTENQIKMNTAKKEMLRMLILFTLSYLPYTADNSVVLNDTIMPVQPVKQLLYYLYSFNIFNQCQK